MRVAYDILLKSFRLGLQLYFKPYFNRRSAHKIMRSKVVGVPTLGISGLPLGSSGTKCHLDMGLVKKHKVYYKGEGGGFPQVRAVVSLVSPKLLVACPSTKNAQTMH
jgi:hypothetical protein